MEWTPVQSAAKNAQGQYMALVNGQWVPAQGAAKNAQGQYMAYGIQQQPAQPTQPQQPQQSGAIGQLAQSAGEGLHMGGIQGALLGPMATAISNLSKSYEHLTSMLGEKATLGLSKIGAAPEVAGGVGAAVKTAGELPPMLVGGEAAKLADVTFESAAKDLMQSAIKPTLRQLEKGDAATAIDTMLKENIPLSTKGVEKLHDKIDTLNNLIKEKVAQSTDTVNKQTVAGYLSDLLEKFKQQVNPGADIQKVKAAWDEFINHPSLLGKDEIPVKLAQDLKTGTYRQLAGKYGEMGSAETEAQKTLARGLKEEIAKKVPEITLLNKEESRYLRTLKVAERRILLDANKNPMGLSLLAKDPKAWAAFMADRSPAFKSLAARMLYRSKNLTRGLGAVGTEATTQAVPYYEDITNRQQQ